MWLFYIIVVAVLHSKFEYNWIKSLIAGAIIFISGFLLFYLLLSDTSSSIALIGIGLGIVLLLNYFKNQEEKKKIKEWFNLGYNPYLDTEEMLQEFAVSTKGQYQYDLFEIPIGRATGFMQDFEGIDSDNIQFFGYSPVRSEEKVELREYGLLVTNKGILLKTQIKKVVIDSQTNKKSNVSEPDTIYLPFAGLWSLSGKNNTVTFKYSDSTIQKITYNQFPFLKSAVFQEIIHLIEQGVTRNLLFENEAKSLSNSQIKETDNQVQEAYDVLRKKQNIGLGAYQGFIGGEIFQNNISNHMKDIQLNAQVKQIMRRDGRLDTFAGKGEAAEYANNVRDKHLFKDVSSDGGGFSNLDPKGQGRNAVDRTIRNRFTGETTHVQSKYYRTAEETYNSFKNGKYSDNVGIEVPAEQYNKVKEIMKSNGDTRPLIKGVSTKWAMSVTKAGTIASITTDVMDGAMLSAKGASISFIIIFAQAKVQGYDTKEAAKMSTMSAVQTLGVGTLFYAGSQQFAKTKLGLAIGKQLGKSTSEIARYSSGVITIGIVYGPSIADCMRGRISVNQLIKNSTIGSASLVGGAIGSSVGPVGAVIGGMVGGFVGKKIVDTMIEDDALESYELFKEEFLDYMYSARLSQSELDELINRTFAHKKFSKILKDIYQASGNYEGNFGEQAQRNYINSRVLEPNIIGIFSQRKKINEDEINEALNIRNDLVWNTVTS